MRGVAPSLLIIVNKHIMVDLHFHFPMAVSGGFICTSRSGTPTTKSALALQEWAWS
jgi:hypothetical protein